MVVDNMDFNSGFVLPTPEGITVESFTNELRAVSDSLVQGSLSQYAAYTLKGQAARDHLSEAKTSNPTLLAEAKLRGMTEEQLAKLIVAKGEKMNSLVSSIELLRLEFAARYAEAADKLALRDEMLVKLKKLTS